MQADCRVFFHRLQRLLSSLSSLERHPESSQRGALYRRQTIRDDRVLYNPL